MVAISRFGRPARWLAVGVVTALLVCAGCGGAAGGRLVQGFGTFDLGDDLTLRVSTRGMTLIEYEVRDRSVDRVLVAEPIGRDAGRWFLFWDEHGRLWVHGRDTGTRVWVPSGTGKFYKHPLISGSQFMESVPPAVASRLPSSERRALGLADASR